VHGTLGGQNPALGRRADEGDEPSGEEQTVEEDCGVPTNKQRRATAKRKLERQLERRAQQARRRRILMIAAAAGVVVVVAGLAVWQFGFNKSSHRTSTASSTTSSVAPTPDTATPAQAGVLPPFKPPANLGANCQYQPTPAEPAAKKVDPPNAGKVPTDPARISMSIATNQGPLGVQLDNAQAPCTVNNFVSLAQKGYFNDTHCHRLTTGPTLFVLQCGDPKGDGTGGPGYQFADEYPSNQYLPDDPARSKPIVYPRGTLAMANAGPGTNGSQFFIVYQDSQLPPNYTIFGKVDEKDMGVLDKIASAKTADGSPDGKPKTDVVITSARLD
jgi:peptidyl-prolyl cis-trans isomerase B (cyclophilin B)